MLSEAEWPERVPRSAFGPTVQAWVGLLSGAYRLSKPQHRDAVVRRLRHRPGLGSVSQLEQHVSTAIAAPVAQARDYVRRQTAVHIDETGWRQARDKAWLWTVASDQVTVFAIRSRRDTEVARDLLGADTTAVVGSDRYTAYGYLPVLQRQTCWAHLARTFDTFVDRGGEAAKAGKMLLQCTHQMFTWWHRVRDGTLQRSSFQVYVNELRHQVRFQLWYGQHCADAKTGGHLRQPAPDRASPVDLRPQGRRRADQQRRRTRLASRCIVASHQLRYAQPCR